jgi:hypothetical protein
MASIKGHENRTIQNTKPDSSVFLSQAAPLQLEAHAANDLGLCHDEIQKVGIIVNKIII